MKWIDVKERLPPVDVDVIVCGDGVQSGGNYAYGKWWDRSGAAWRDVFTSDVTHWRKLDWPKKASTTNK